MKPTYDVRVWRDGDRWLARVAAASVDAHPTPLDALTQTRWLADVESTTRDLIATILDVSEDDFDVRFQYDLTDLRDASRLARVGIRATEE